MDKAVDIADRSQGKAVFLEHASDQTGGGVSGDACYLVRGFLGAGITRATFGLIWDPAVVEMSFQLGFQDESLLRIGEKSEPQLGSPGY